MQHLEEEEMTQPRKISIITVQLTARLDVHHLISWKLHPSFCASESRTRRHRGKPQLCSLGGGCDSRIFCIANTGLTILGWLLSYLGYTKLQDPCCLTFVFLLTLGLSLMSILIVDSSMFIFTSRRGVNYFIASYYLHDLEMMCLITHFHKLPTVIHLTARTSCGKLIQISWNVTCKDSVYPEYRL